MLAGAALLLAGCAGDGGREGARARVFGVERIPQGQAATLRGGRPPLVLVGADAATAAEVAPRLRVPPGSGGAAFVPAAPDESGPRLVLAVGGAQASCATTGDDAGSGAAQAAALWCIGNRVRARAQGSGAPFAATTAPGFERAVQRMIDAMLQPSRPNTPGR
ncbi:MAG TPA: hypothetical protein VJ994_02460 [Paracoccaceae bacterium]|nr:hypothetical protein [Paracoccaceae bacterium]